MLDRLAIVRFGAQFPPAAWYQILWLGTLAPGPAGFGIPATQIVYFSDKLFKTFFSQNICKFRGTGLNLRIVSPLKFSSMKKIIFKTIKQGARAGGSLINQAGVGVELSKWTPAVWLHPVTSRGFVSDRCYLSVPTSAAPAVAAAMCSVEEHGLNLYLALVRCSPVVFTGPVWQTVPVSHRGGWFRLFSVSRGRSQVEHVETGCIYDVHNTNIQIV